MTVDPTTPRTPSQVPQIPGFELLEKIGEGGMGEVYRARQLSLQRIVAIKLLNPFPNDQAPIRAFQRESHLMASLAHPNIVMMHDRGQIDGRHYLVMEFVAGANLRSFLQPGKPWNAGEAMRVIDAMAQALSYIHEQGILHLDLKPENVLCGHNGDVKITDFGLALPHVDAWTLSELGLAQGTIDYCSPEQRYGLPIDRRSDLFSLATLVYEMLTGVLPGRVYVPASQRNHRLPRAVDDILQRGLARDPDERHATVEDFRRELLAVLGPMAPRSTWRQLLAALGLSALFGVSLTRTGWDAQISDPPSVAGERQPAAVRPAAACDSVAGAQPSPVV